MEEFVLELNQTLATIGDKIIGSVLLKNVLDGTITLVEDSTSSNADLTRYYRYSFDNKQFSTWKEYDISLGEITVPFDSGEDLYIEFKYVLNSGEIELNTLTLTYDGEAATMSCPLNINVVDFDGDPVDSFVNIEECATDIVNMYDKNKIKYIYNNVNSVFNEINGHDVKYFKVQEDISTEDSIFKEYSLHNVISQKDLKIVIPNNEIPLNRDLNISAWDLGYQDLFEIHILVSEFCDAFDTERAEYQFNKPEKRDFMYIPLLEQMFEIESVEPMDRRASESLYWKIFLKTHSMHGDLAHDSELTEEEENAISFTADEEFESEMEEGNEYSSPTQSYTGHEKYNPVRSFINSDLEIVSEEINNNYTVVSYTNYNLDSIPVNDFGVKYKNHLNLNDESNFHFSSWFKKHSTSFQLINSNDIEINVNANALEFLANGTTYTFSEFTLEDNQWYSYVLEGSNLGNWIRLSIYEIDDTNNTTKLKRVFLDDQELINNIEVNDLEISLLSSTINITNIRVLTKTINIENHSNFLTKNVIEEDRNVIIVDQAMRSTDDRYIK